MAGCTCVNVPMGSYKNQVVVNTPVGNRVGIDRCLMPDIRQLWNMGIKTVASCCGHGIAPGVISVEPGFDGAMLELGYERMPVSPGQNYEHSFYWPRKEPDHGP